MRDDLGNRMKKQYEDRTRIMLPRRTWTVIRADGKAFHTITRGCAKPFDAHLHAAMVHAAKALCEEAQGARCAFVQSDEISVILNDATDIRTEAWFDGNLQKIVSVAASAVTAAFVRAWDEYTGVSRTPLFDARAFTIPDPVEVENYLIWRQKDAIRNSVQALAQAHFSPRQLHGLGQVDMLTMLAGVGVVWADSPAHVRHGTVILRGDDWKPDFEAPVFTERRDYLVAMLATPIP